jgi:hypothetical protein
MLGRRFLILVAVLMGLTALAASVAPRQPTDREDRREATATPAQASGSPTFTTVQKELSTLDGDDARVTVREGDLVALTVSGPVSDSVILLNRMETINPASPARFSLLASKPGDYPIELVDADRQIGTLVVR